MLKNGLFLVFEGIDASGTSTQAHRLMKVIEEKDKYLDVLKTHEPWRSAEIKRRLREDGDAYSDGERMAELYVADRQMHVERIIRPTLNEDAVVISDRYWLSTYAYQQTQGMDLKRLIEMHQHRG